MSGSRKRKPTRDAVQKVAKQENGNVDNGSVESIMNALLDHNNTNNNYDNSPVLTPQQLLEFTLASYLSNNQNETLSGNSFNSSNMMSNDASLMNAINSFQSSTPNNGKKSPNAKKSPKRSASPGLTNGKDDVRAAKISKDEEFSMTVCF